MNIHLYRLLFVALLALTSCGSGQEKNAETQNGPASDSLKSDTSVSKVAPDSIEAKSSENTEKAVNEQKSNKANSAWVSGQAFYRNSYCGGARPTAEVEAKYRTEYPLKSQNIRFVNDANASLVVEVKTDASGNFAAALSYGSWTYYLRPTAGSSIPPNPNCEKYFTEAYGQIEVGAGTTTGHHLLYSFRCNPCDPYANRRP